MSSEVNTSADLRNFPKTSEDTKEDMESGDLCPTQSSILYLLQEASKLVTPPESNSLDKEQLQEGTKETMASHTSTNTEPDVQEVGAVKTPPSFTGAFSMLSRNPWEAMSLINLQCERLLQSGEPHGETEGSQVQDSKTEERDAIKEWSSFLSTVSTSSPVSLNAGPKEPAMETDACCAVPHIPDPTNHLSSGSTSETSESNAAEDLAELISSTTQDSSVFSRLNNDRTDHCSLVEALALPLDLTKKAGICEQSEEGEGANETARVSFRSDAAQSPGRSLVDFTSCLVAEQCDDPCFSFKKENVERECTLMSETTSSRTDLNNNLEDEVLQEPEKTCSVSSDQAACSNRRRTPRKQAHPARSPDLNDPGLQGVTFSMHTELERKKTCASCCTRKTPLWRDAEDGTPLCNACGIRYKKYGVRCLQCWNIPRKEANFTSKCLKCGELLPYSPQPSKRTGC
ncbi:GATA-type zinc finger protein 1 [Bagarius yarrelli]|uniref:GATA-type zinc finger protein 1 n=1 Tax=Bagarius yarrelli TaxID=175774 RepID=A0A556TTM0_BAGYA|nr:GATA-type zinc finger protein 1 [Bagarius yarrelli]